MIKVAIIDDHPMVVQGIQALLDNDSDVTFIGAAHSVTQGKAFLIQNQPNVILLDINLPDGSGIDLCQFISEKYPLIAILAISTFNQGSYINKMLENGALGYVLKNVSKIELKKAITEVNKGNKFMSFETVQTLKAEKATTQNNLVLSRREKEVLLLIADGLTNNEIAENLTISSSTVDTYRKSLLAKLGAKNTAELIKIAFVNKLMQF